MQATLSRWASASRARGQRFRPSWMSPGLSSHQQLDAGIAARQHAGRKALKKSKRPFDNYFKTAFRFSPRVRLPVTRTSGVISSFNATRLMTDPTSSWSAPWDRAGWRGRSSRKRQDVLEPAPVQFGEDAVDRVVERLLEVRFAWDREDGVLCTSVVPESLFAAATHCRPYVTEVTPPPLLSSSAALEPSPDAPDVEEGESIVIAGTLVRIKRRTPRIRRKSGQPKRPHTRTTLGFSGVDTVPSLVLDVSHGPFLTSPSVPLMTLRWKGEHRDAASAQTVLQLLRQVRVVPAVGLAPRSALLLLKALATAEVEEPALAVSLAIAVGEHYHAYSDTECLEVLRCLRRLALVRALPDIAAPDIHTDAVRTAVTVDGRALPPLYADPALTDTLLARYLGDAAPFLVAKVWARLPEQSRHLLHRGYALDWFDLVSLAVAAAGPHHLPQRLPNPVSEAPYAAKYLFLRHTLGLTEEVLGDLVERLRGTGSTLLSTPPKGTAAAAAVRKSVVDPHALHQHTVPDSVAARADRGDSTAPSPFLDDLKEEVDKPLVLWLCAALLVRLVAESLGDVVRHVGNSLHEHAALAAEQAEAHESASGNAARVSGAEEGDAEGGAAVLALPHPYPRFSNGAYQQMGCRRPKRVRVRLLPFEAFPRVSRCFSCPFASVTEKAVAQERQRHRRAHLDKTRALAKPDAHASEKPREVESTFATVLADSPLMAKHIERGVAAFTWGTSTLRACHAMVRGLPHMRAPPLAVSAPSEQGDGNSGAAAASDAARDSTSSSSPPPATPPPHRRDEWARESVAMEVRHALCYRFVRATVQQQMDALFAYIPWAEMEAAWKPMLTQSAVDTCAGDAAAPGAAGEGSEDDGAAAALSAVLMEDDGSAGRVDVSASDPAATAPASPSAPLSRAEREARATMEEMRERLEDFQVVVADLLEAHEAAFPPATAAATSSPR